MTMHFMGETFESVEHLRRFYPAYCGNDAIRAIKAGASTPTEVETHVYRNSAAFKRAQLAQARANGKKLVQPTVSKAEKAKRQRRAGSAKGGATMRRKASGFSMVEFLIVAAIVAILVAIVWAAWKDAHSPVIELKAADWNCTAQREERGMRPQPVGKVTVMVPYTRKVCVRWEKF